MIARWQTLIASFHFDTIHRAGTRQTNANTLSRRTDHPLDPIADETLQPSDTLDVCQLRFPAVSTLTTRGVGTLSLQDIARATTKDPDLSFVRTWVEKGAHYDPGDQLRLVQISPAYLHLAPALQSRHGVLILAVRDQPERIVLPDSLREQAFAAAHDCRQPDILASKRPSRP